MGNTPNFDGYSIQEVVDLKANIAFEFLYEEQIKERLKRRKDYFGKLLYLPHITTDVNDSTNRAYLRAHMRERFFNHLHVLDPDPIGYSPIITMKAFVDAAKTLAFDVKPHGG